MATTFQVLGKPPPSVWDALTTRQRRSLDQYINRRVVERCYRVAYDVGYDAGLAARNKKVKKRKISPSPPISEGAG